MTRSSRLFDRRRYSEMRRRIIRAALAPVFRASDARLRETRNLCGRDIRRILICRPNHRLGNLLLLTPLLTEIQRVFPDAEVDLVLAGDDGAELFAGFGNVGRVYVLSRRMVRHPLALVRTAVQIRRTGYDLAIDPCEASQSGRLLVLLAHAKCVIGLPRDATPADAEEREALLAAPHHIAQWPVYLLRHALARRLPDADGDFPAPDIRLSADERRLASAALDELLRADGQPHAGMVVGVFAEATGGKRYPRDWWQRFIAAVRRGHPDCAFVEILPPDDRPRLALGLPTFCSRSPRKVAAMISDMTCFVSADCGVMHLASASGTPTLGLFSITDVSKYEPYGRGSRGFATNGKSPEEVAQLASAHVEALIAADFRASEPPLPQDGGKTRQAGPHPDPANAIREFRHAFP